MILMMKLLVSAALIYLLTHTYLYVVRFREKISCTTGMMITMILGTMSGLIIGTLLGHDFNYSVNTLLAMIIGIGVGVIAGIPFQTMAVLEGMMAGVMGGTMGAMLGAMLSPDYVMVMSFLLTAVLWISVILVKKMISQEAGIEPAAKYNEARTAKLSILIVCLTTVLFGLVALSTVSVSHFQLPDQAEDPHKGHVMPK